MGLPPSIDDSTDDEDMPDLIEVQHLQENEVPQQPHNVISAEHDDIQDLAAVFRASV
jgi:hypothetical protein